jgi:hypothetical protein
MSTKAIVKFAPVTQDSFIQVVINIFTGAGYSPYGQGTNSMIFRNDGVCIEIDKESKLYKGVYPDESYTYDRVFWLPHNMVEFVNYITSESVDKSIKKTTREIRQTPGYQPEQKPGKVSPLFRVGQQVVVNNADCCYTSYNKVFDLMGFKNTKENLPGNISNVGCKIATIFDMEYHLDFRTRMLCGIRFDDGKELLIGQEGLREFTGFEKSDLVVILPSDDYFFTIPKEDVGVAVKVREKSSPIFSSSEILWTKVLFSDGSKNTYTKLRYANDSEKNEYANKNSKQTFIIGESTRARTIEVSLGGIILHDSQRREVLKIDVDHLREVVTEMSNFKPHFKSRYWQMSIPKINIGCVENVTYSQLKDILDYATHIGLD